MTCRSCGRPSFSSLAVNPRSKSGLCLLGTAKYPACFNCAITDTGKVILRVVCLGTNYIDRPLRLLYNYHADTSADTKLMFYFNIGLAVPLL